MTVDIATSSYAYSVFCLFPTVSHLRHPSPIRHRCFSRMSDGPRATVGLHTNLTASTIPSLSKHFSIFSFSFVLLSAVFVLFFF